MTKGWYKKFLQEVKELEKNLPCPQCGSQLILHTNPMGYDFVCSSCGFTFEHKEGKYSEKIKSMLYK